MNKVVLIGRLAHDPELKFTPGTGTAIAQTSLAVERKTKNKDGKKEVDFIPIVVWGKTAEAFANYKKKGDTIGVSGRLQIDQYTKKDGSKAYAAKVEVEEVDYAGNKSSSSNSENSGSGGNDDGYTPAYDDTMPF